MLVYANHLCVQGPSAERVVFKAVGAWLKEQLGFGLHPDRLRHDGEFDGQRGEQRARLRIHGCYDGEPALCAWVLKHSDEDVHGRQWIVEAGVKKFAGTLEVSCVVKTDERSALVSSPVDASQPRVIRYITNNVLSAQDTGFVGGVPGEAQKTVGQDSDSYRGLLVEIERLGREGAIVLVSANPEGEYLVSPIELQMTLFGLAQVVRVQQGADSHEMQQILGRKWSAWDGAVNVLAAPSASGVRSRYFLRDAIREWGTKRERISQVLTWVTASTNIAQLRKHVRPEGVIQLSMRRRLDKVRVVSAQLNEVQLRRELADALNQVAEQDRIFDEIVKENADLVAEVSRYRDDFREAQDELRNKDYQIKSMQEALPAPTDNGSGGTFNPEQLLKIFARKEEPNPLECIDLIEQVYGDRCTVLDTARSSASKMTQFVLGRDLLDLLMRLVTTYRDRLMDGGDSEARKVFGRGEFAAKESKTVMNSPMMRSQRTFDYGGRKVEMFRHLKIGVADDQARTIRVHFYWDASLRKIVIGHCGRHLPVSSH